MNFLSFVQTDRIPQNETPSICKACGSCCKGQPGGYAPDQFDTVEQVKAIIKSGKAIADYWISNEGNVYFLRPPKGDEGKLEASWNIFSLKEPCINLSSKGCILSWNDRPHGCRALQAKMENEERACKGMYSENGNSVNTKKILAYEWHKSKFNLYEIINNLQAEY